MSKVKTLRHKVTAYGIARGSTVNRAIKEGWQVGLNAALAPVLPTWLVGLTTKVVVPFLVLYTRTAVNRSIINSRTKQQGQRLKAAVSAEEYKKAFNDLASI